MDKAESTNSQLNAGQFLPNEMGMMKDDLREPLHPPSRWDVDGNYLAKSSRFKWLEDVAEIAEKDKHNSLEPRSWVTGGSSGLAENVAGCRVLCVFESEPWLRHFPTTQPWVGNACAPAGWQWNTHGVTTSSMGHLQSLQMDDSPSTCLIIKQY